MLVLHTDVTLTCQDTKTEVILHQNCFSCEKLQGVEMKHVYKASFYEVTITCNGAMQPAKIFVICPKDKQHYCVQEKCFPCTEFSHLTSIGQTIRLGCKFDDPTTQRAAAGEKYSNSPQAAQK